jgi:DNA gyrase subunit A
VPRASIALTETKGGLAGALVVREHQDLVFISRDGMVQRTAVRGINRYGRGAQGVKVMNTKDDDIVSAVALVIASDDDPPAETAEIAGLGEAPVEEGEAFVALDPVIEETEEDEG